MGCSQNMENYRENSMEQDMEKGACSALHGWASD